MQRTLISENIFSNSPKLSSNSSETETRKRQMEKFGLTIKTNEKHDTRDDNWQQIDYCCCSFSGVIAGLRPQQDTFYVEQKLENINLHINWHLCLEKN